MKVLFALLISVLTLLASSAISFAQCSPGDPDADGDGVCDAIDACPGADDLIDYDRDGIPFGCDSCVDFDNNEDCDIDEANLFVYFSQERGFYDQSFSLQLASNDAAAIIKYSTDGSDPQTNGSTYSGPITISTTTPVRAIASLNGQSSKLLSNTYIFTADVINQPASVSGFPSVNLGIHSSVKNDPVWSPQMEAALKSIGTVCINMEVADFSTVYTTKSLEKPINFEYFDADLNIGEPAGVNTYGNTSWNTNKKNYRVKFKTIYGQGKLEAPIFGEDAAQEFDVIDLRCGSQQTMIRGGVQNIHENFFKEIQIKLSGDGPHTFFAHLYFNGVYWGVYSGSERPAKHFGETYFGGDKENYNTIKGPCCIQSPTAEDGNTASYQALATEATNYNTIGQYLDIDNYMNYVMLCNFGPHGDWTPWNTYAIDNPTDGVPFRFFMWDPEPSLYSSTGYFTNVISGTTSYFQNIWNPLYNHLDFRVDFGDNLQCKCVEEDGPLYPANAEQHYLDIFDENSLAYLMEAAKWKSLSLYLDFLDYRDDLVSDSWFSNRISDMLNAQQNNELYSTTSAVDFNIEGGAITSLDQLCLSHSNTNGTLYYTLDGSDPRLPGGTVNPTALIYNGCVTLSPGVHAVKARVLNNSQSNSFHKWSSMCPKEFYVDQEYTDLAINEIHYNPLDSITNTGDTISGTSFEFVEIKNTGANSIDLKGLAISKGISLQVDHHLILPAGDFLVLAEDSIQFLAKYGFSPHRQFRGKLNNKGETIELLDPLGNTVDIVTYDDSSPWPKMADEGIMSLALLNGQLDNSLSDNWDIQSCSISPGLENDFSLSEASTRIRINEIHYHPLDSIGQGVVIGDDNFEFIELHNSSNLSVDLSNFFFAKGIEYVFPTGSIIPANSYVTLAKSSSLFSDRFNVTPLGQYDGKLSNSGEMIWLMNAKGKLIDFVDYTDDAPWPVDADGTGMSLSFREEEFSNNELAVNWDVQSVELSPSSINIFNTCRPENFTSPPIGLTHFVNFGAGTVTLSWTTYEYSTACMIRAWYASLPANKVVIFVGNLNTEQSPAQLTLPISAVASGVQYEWDVICGCSLDPLVASPFSAPQPFELNNSPP